jgi:hypothetical protein
MRCSVLCIIVLSSTSILLGGCASSQHARHAPQHASGADGGVVTADSRYGHGTVSGPVRRGPHGRAEVRAPGGTWFECGRDCAETLRRETVDFWESRGGANAQPDGPAHLRWHW